MPRNLIKNVAVFEVFQTYPPAIHKRAMQLRRLVLDTAADLRSNRGGAVSVVDEFVCSIPTIPCGVAINP